MTGSLVWFLKSSSAGLFMLASITCTQLFLIRGLYFPFPVEHCYSLQLLHGPEAGGVQSVQRLQAETRAVRYSYKHLHFLARIEHIQQLQTCFSSSRIISTTYNILGRLPFAFNNGLLYARKH